MTHKWTYVGEGNKAVIYVDYKQRVTKIVSFKYTYLHRGIYPYHNPEYYRRYKTKNSYEK